MLLAIHMLTTLAQYMHKTLQTLSTVGLYWDIGPAENVKPGSTVPFSRDDNFVVRKGIFEQLDEALSPTRSCRWAALYGLGGIGKSQIAIEYSYRARDLDPAVWVFWVSAVNRESFMQSFSTISERLNIIGRTESKADMLTAVSRWLSNESNGPWFILLDNEDDIEVLHKTSEEGSRSDFKPKPPLVHYIPNKPHGRVLITSRNKRAALSTVGDNKKIIQVERMDEEESFDLLRSRISLKSEDEEDARILVATLDYIPLAISQAGAYIHELRSMLTIKGYLKHFNQNTTNQVKFLRKQERELRRDQDVPNSIIVAWEISFQQIKSQSVDAANLLCFLAMLHRQDIPMDLVKSGDIIQTWEDIGLLEAYSFITVSRPEEEVALDEDDRRISLHRLIQLAVRTWLESNGQLTQQNNKATRKVAERFPTEFSSRNEWNYMTSLTLHADELLKSDLTTEREDVLSRADLLDKLARYENAVGNHGLAEDRAGVSLELFKAYCDENDIRVTISLITWAEAVAMRGRYNEVEAILKQGEEDLRHEVGTEQKEMLRARATLAIIRFRQQKYDDAQKLEEQVLEMAKVWWEPDHPNLLTCKANLAIIYVETNLLDQAVFLLVQVLEAQQKILGPDHPVTLVSMRNLAIIYRKQGKLKESEKLMLENLEMTRTVLGPERPDTLDSMNALAMVYYHQGRYEEAVLLLGQCVELSGTAIGSYQEADLAHKNNLAGNLIKLGRYDEAEKLVRENIKVSIDILPRYGVDTLYRGVDLAEGWFSSGKMVQAVDLLEEVVRLMIKHLGEAHEDTVESKSTLESYKSVYNELGRPLGSSERVAKGLTQLQHFENSPEFSSNVEFMRVISFIRCLKSELIG